MQLFNVFDSANTAAGRITLLTLAALALISATTQSGTHVNATPMHATDVTSAAAADYTGSNSMLKQLAKERESRKRVDVASSTQPANANAPVTATPMKPSTDTPSAGQDGGNVVTQNAEQPAQQTTPEAPTTQSADTLPPQVERGLGRLPDDTHMSELFGKVIRHVHPKHFGALRVTNSEMMTLVDHEADVRRRQQLPEEYDECQRCIDDTLPKLFSGMNTKVAYNHVTGLLFGEGNRGLADQFVQKLESSCANQCKSALNQEQEEKAITDGQKPFFSIWPIVQLATDGFFPVLLETFDRSVRDPQFALQAQWGTTDLVHVIKLTGSLGLEKGAMAVFKHLTTLRLPLHTGLHYDSFLRDSYFLELHQSLIIPTWFCTSHYYCGDDMAMVIKRMLHPDGSSYIREDLRATTKIVEPPLSIEAFFQLMFERFAPEGLGGVEKKKYDEWLLQSRDDFRKNVDQGCHPMSLALPSLADVTINTRLTTTIFGQTFDDKFNNHHFFQFIVRYFDIEWAKKFYDTVFGPLGVDYPDTVAMACQSEYGTALMEHIFKSWKQQAKTPDPTQLGHALYIAVATCKDDANLDSFLTGIKHFIDQLDSKGKSDVSKFVARKQKESKDQNLKIRPDNKCRVYHEQWVEPRFQKIMEMLSTTGPSPASDKNTSAELESKQQNK